MNKILTFIASTPPSPQKKNHHNHKIINHNQQKKKTFYVHQRINKPRRLIHFDSQEKQAV